jgi:hypothetical protein
MNKLVRYVPDADLRQGYTGLNKKVPMSKLKQGEFVAFVNRARNKIKLCTQNDLVAYLRMPRGTKIDPRVIQYLPTAFNGTEIDYDKAMEASLRKSFPKWFKAQLKDAG